MNAALGDERRLQSRRQGEGLDSDAQERARQGYGRTSRAVASQRRGIVHRDTTADRSHNTLGLKNHRVVKVAEVHGRVVVWLDRIRRRHLPCSVCGTFDPVKDRLPERSWRHVPLWGIEVELRYRPWATQTSRTSSATSPKSLG